MKNWQLVICFFVLACESYSRNTDEKIHLGSDSEKVLGEKIEFAAIDEPNKGTTIVSHKEFLDNVVTIRESINIDTYENGKIREALKSLDEAIANYNKGGEFADMHARIARYELFELAELGIEECQNWLLEGLSSPDRVLRDKSIKYASKIGNQKMINGLIGVLSDMSPHFRDIDYMIGAPRLVAARELGKLFPESPISGKHMLEIADEDISKFIQWHDSKSGLKAEM